MHIHIAFAGQSIESTLRVIRKLPVDKVYVLYGSADEKGQYKGNAERIKASLEAMDCTCELRRVDIFDFLKIVDSIYDIVEENSIEAGNTFSIDITRGTNLSAAAACNAGFYTGAKVYYSQDPNKVSADSISDLVIELPSPRIGDVRNIGAETLEALRYIEDRTLAKKPVTNAEVGKIMGKSAPTAKYHTDRLMDAGLIKRVNPIPRDEGGDGRTKPFVITREGRFVLRWR